MDLRAYIRLLEGCGELARIRVQADPWLEIAAITDRVCKSPGGGKGLLFERVKGSAFPVVTNLFGSVRRSALALSAEEDVEALAKRLRHDLARFRGLPAGERLRLLTEACTHNPPGTSGAPCQEVRITGEVNLAMLPALHSWPNDGGRFLTLPQVFTRDPETGKSNCGMYRIQLHDAATATIRWREGSDAARHAAAWRARNEPMPVAIALGGDTELIYAATAPLPAEVDEVAFAGYLRQEPLSMVRCLVHDLAVPAHAEFVIEGYVDPKEMRREGPFGNHTGYYSSPAEAPVLRVQAITHRSDAIYPATVVGRPPMENCHLAKLNERLLLPLLQIEHPEVVDLHLPLEGIFHRCALVAIATREPGQVHRVIRGLWDRGFLRGAKLLVVVDETVPVHRPAEVFWRVINHLEPTRDIVIDGACIAIDATRDAGKSSLADATDGEVGTDPATLELIERRWQEYAIQLEEPAGSRRSN